MTISNFKFQISNFKYFCCLLFAAYCLLVTVSSAHALTVQEVAEDLACPCECPLVLEDCNMSCGLDWKDQIGQMIKEGKTKEEIIKYFIDKYGDDARITPVQRIRGKFFKYTRAFDAKDWIIFWSVAGIWVVGLFIGIYLLIRRLSTIIKTSDKPAPAGSKQGAAR
ncbi:MAG: cytochrome c-type biogenesis protein CcmH [Deltaproteobacteria bacterium]|nr:cytochrome c-type biogenesis protein CcmH [Deltaproteobacteria bacterium]